MNESDMNRLTELLADNATQGLTAEEQAELNFLQEQLENKRDESFDLAASALSLASINKIEPMPARLRSRIIADAEKYLESSSAESVTKKTENTLNVIDFPKRQKNILQWSGWIVAAAACVIMAFTLWLNRPGVKPIDRELSVSEKREQLIAKAKDLVQTSWKATNVAEGKDIAGDVVWSVTEQKGYMRFRGLPVNDPNKETYQLWIFDKNQDEKYPVDGGIFDVKENGELIVPINAGLNVKEPTLFAITIEKPGGVVVSKRDKLILIASVQ